MKKIFVTFLVILTAIVFPRAQEIQMEKVFGGYKFTQNGATMKMKDLVNTMESNQEAYDLINKAKSNSVLGSIFGGIGGALIGWPLGTALGGGDPNWTLAGVGAGIVAIGIPFSSSANKKAKQAVEIYNSSLTSSSFYEPKLEFQFITNGNGVGFSMRF